MTDILQAVILGTVQGLTEFLPISSSGHLAALPWLFGWKDLGITFDVALHMGTLAALAAYFWKDWIKMLRDWRDPYMWLIVVGCVPAALAGYKFEDYFDTVFRAPVFVGSFMILMGVVMGASERWGGKVRGEDTINLRDALVIGFAQALALMPGVSRSGVTMTAGMFSGLRREAAARFSFLLAMPITAGAGLLKFSHLLKAGLPASEAPAFAAGLLCAAVVGFFAIKYLLKFLQSHSLYVFVWYRLLFGSLILIFNSLR